MLILVALLVTHSHVVVTERYSPEVTQRQRQIFSASLRTEVDKYEVPLAEPASAPSEACEDQKDCLARIAAALGADHLLQAKVSRTGDLDYVSLTLIALPSGEVVKQASGQADQSSGATSLLGELCGKIFTPPRSDLVVGIPADVSKRWSPRPLPKVVFFTGLGLTVAALSVGVGLSVASANAGADYRTYADQGQITVISGATLAEKGQHYTQITSAANALWGTAIGLGVLTALSAIFTDWGSDKVLLQVGIGSIGLSGRF